ncbi:dihydropteroate synthase [Kaistia nematophila]|uniref:Dihydropteroate synthase n=1 Tax=Kaistia nematophila TaxID=2994654 RepID=A0A9X3ILT8_9HYPH|nr:dihydropteroate synthase [Kaistia nematophila]MCX5569180.1 dihydropteroate synthase [Kaistia nematophila]
MAPAAPIDIDHLDRRTSGRSLIMGIVNVTPDSFSDGGDHAEAGPAVAHAEQLIAEGADIIDIGGESTRPGAAEVDAETEAARVIPAVKALAAATRTLISVDTYKASVADMALMAGAHIVNDVWGLQREPEIARVAGAHGAAVIASHWERETYSQATILDAMKRFFDRSIALARGAGIPDHRIVLDPGIGFGKGLAENLLILDRIDEIVALGFPVLLGVSRKRFIGEITGREPKQRLAGTLATNVLAAAKGVSSFRVHDVAAHRDALAVTDAILSSREPQ